MSEFVFNPLILLKFVFCLFAIVFSTVLLIKRKVFFFQRLFLVLFGIIVFGFIFTAIIPNGQNPNPPQILRTLLRGIILDPAFIFPSILILAAMLTTVWISNKSICGWGCQLGLLQDFFYIIKQPKWKAPFWLSNSIRIIAFLALVGGILVAGLDWIGIVDPFKFFSFKMGWWIGGFVLLIIVASFITYRPWCNFLCPFGLVSWLVEQKSILRPRIRREVCAGCTLCVDVCPTWAMRDIYAEKKIHADCFACGSCIAACPEDGALEWRSEKGKARNSQ